MVFGQLGGNVFICSTASMGKLSSAIGKFLG